MSDRLTQLQKLHAADPSDPFCTYGIALEHAKAKRLDEALPWLDRTLALDANYFYAYFQKGKILSELGRTDEARAALQTGLKASQRTDAKAAGEIAALLESL